MDKSQTEKTAYEAGFWDRFVGRHQRLFFRRNWYSYVNMHVWERIMEELGDLQGRRVLFVGCGESAGAAKMMARGGGQIWCLDVSARSIEILMRHPFGKLQSRIHPVVADAEEMPFDDGFFDVAVGKAIIHHLDIPRFMKGLRRVCAPGARIVFGEPLGTNPFINLFRRLTPGLRVPTEHPLMPADTREIERHCRSLRLCYSECLVAASFPWFFVGLRRIGRFIYTLLSAADAAMFRLIPPTRRLAWSVIIVGDLLGKSPER